MVWRLKTIGLLSFIFFLFISRKNVSIFFEIYHVRLYYWFWLQLSDKTGETLICLFTMATSLSPSLPFHLQCLNHRLQIWPDQSEAGRLKLQPQSDLRLLLTNPLLSLFIDSQSLGPVFATFTTFDANKLASNGPTVNASLPVVATFVRAGKT